MNLSDYEAATLNTNYSYYEDHDYVGTPCTDVKCILLAISFAIICILSITGNGLVIWIAGFKLNKSINSMWYLSLAVSNFLFGAFLPFLIVYLVMQGWIWGSFMCKLRAFIYELSIYSSVFLLVIISMDRCVAVNFPCWAQNNRTVKKCSVVIIFIWILATALSIHPATAREIYWRVCAFNTNYNELKVMMGINVAFGFAIPVLMIICCYIAIMLKLRANKMIMCTKPFKVMTLLIVMFIICWLPYYIMTFVELIDITHNVVIEMQQFILLLAFSNSFMNPLLYTFIGKDPKKRFYNILSKIKNAFEEEDQCSIHYAEMVITN